MPDPSRLLIAPDVRAAEARLFAELEGHFAAREPPATLARAEVVVASNSLRSDLLGRLALLRPAWLGLRVVTVRALALDLLARSGEEPPRGAPLFEIELTRAARRRKALAGAFGEFADGWAPLATAARDLVDAGLGPEHLEALTERIDAESGHLARTTLARARSLVASLGETLAALEAHGLRPDAEPFRLAAEVVRRDGLPPDSRALFLHGFSDATGVISDLLEALARRGGLTALLVQPTGSATGQTPWSFGRRLYERLAGAIGAPSELAAAPAARRTEWVLPSRELEARAAVAGARRAMDEGVSPERIALVVRAPGPHRAALRRELDRQGVPFSGSGAVGPADPGAQRSSALLRAFELGPETPIDVAVDLVGPEAAAERGSLRLALRALGCVRLAAAAALRPAAFDVFRSEGFPLPVRAGMVAREAVPAPDEADPEVRPLVRRRLAVESLEELLSALRRFASAVGRWPAEAPWSTHREALERCLRAGGLAAAPAGRRLLDASARVDAEIPGALRLERDEAIRLLRNADERDSTVSAGRGGGVQLLTVVEARSRTFDRLFVLGLVRGGFPRVVAVEPVLPDSLRRRLRDLLPDLPVKAEGHDEERFLFAQLANAAPEVVLTRSIADEDGRPLPPSPLLEGLRRGGQLDRAPAPVAEPSPLLDRAIAAGLTAGAPGLEELLPAALEEGRRRFGPPDAEDVWAAGRARLRVLAEFETDPAEATGRERIRTLGPYFGLLGRSTLGDQSAATTLEAHAACAWQAFLERTLRLEPIPDSLEALPTLDRRWIGTTVHEVLRRLFDAGEGGERSLDSALAGEGPPLSWPEPEAVRELARGAARATLRRAGRTGGGLERLLTEAALVHLDQARGLDEAGAPATALGTELEGGCELEDDRRQRTRVTFRVDRLSREGTVAILADFKIGRPGERLRAKVEAKKREKLLAAVRAGSRLQAALYLAGAASDEAEARYLFLAPDLPDEWRAYRLRPAADAAAALSSAAATLLGARRRGLHPPRLVDARLEDEYEGCERCAVAEACVRGDSGFRLRLERWHELQAANTGARTDSDSALWRLWRLPAGDGESGS